MLAGQGVLAGASGRRSHRGRALRPPRRRAGPRRASARWAQQHPVTRSVRSNVGRRGIRRGDDSGARRVFGCRVVRREARRRAGRGRGATARRPRGTTRQPEPQGALHGQILYMMHTMRLSSGLRRDAVRETAAAARPSEAREEPHRDACRSPVDPVRARVFRCPRAGVVARAGRRALGAHAFEHPARRCVCRPPRGRCTARPTAPWGQWRRRSISASRVSSEAQPRWTWTPPGAAAAAGDDGARGRGVRRGPPGHVRRVPARDGPRVGLPSGYGARGSPRARAGRGRLPARPLLRTVRAWEDARPAAGRRGGVAAGGRAGAAVSARPAATPVQSRNRRSRWPTGRSSRPRSGSSRTRQAVRMLPTGM